MTHLELAKQFLRQGAFAEAVQAIRSGDTSERSQTEALLILAICLARLERTNEAIATLDELLSRDPNCYPGLSWMATLKQREDPSKAVLFAQRAVNLRPNDAAAHSVLGGSYLCAGKSELAVNAFKSAASLSPLDGEHQHNLGKAYSRVRRNGEAILHLKRAIRLAPAQAQFYLTLSEEHIACGALTKAVACLTEGLTHSPNSAALHTSAGNAYTLLRKDKEAGIHLRRAVELSPDARDGYAVWLLNQGQFNEANAIYEDLIRENPQSGIGYYGVLQCRKLTEADAPMLQKMKALTSDPAQEQLSKMYLHYALGKATEQHKEFEAAMTHYDDANQLAHRIHNGALKANFEEERVAHDHVIKAYENLVHRSSTGRESDISIFIVGMIRSGTTLLDQIVSSHRSVTSAGELRFWIEESLRLTSKGRTPTNGELEAAADEYLELLHTLSGNSERITDKMPLNFAYAGIIHRALPNARILHIRRHPVDTCLSIFSTYFGENTPFAYDRENIVAHYREYQRMMAYWRSALPENRLLEFEYEDLISIPETVIPKVIQFCGLEWDENCLRHDRNLSTINTPSRWQARQPIYKSSLERWRNYEPWLGKFADLIP